MIHTCNIGVILLGCNTPGRYTLSLEKFIFSLDSLRDSTVFTCNVGRATILYQLENKIKYKCRQMTSSNSDSPIDEAEIKPDAGLSGVNFTDPDFSGVDLHNSDLSSANLTNVDLSDANPSVASLNDATLSEVNFT